MSAAISSERCILLFTRRACLAVGLLALASLLVGEGKAQSAERAGAVEALKGEAFAQTEVARRALETAGPVFVRDKIGTGAASRLAMRLGRDTLLRLGESASVTLDRFLVNAGGEITLEAGPVLFERPARANPAPVQIRSPFGLIAVRGTRFFAGPSNGVFGVFVERGSVAVSGAGKRVVVRAGEGTNIAQPGAAPTPPARWGDARIRAALDSVL